MQKRSSSYLYPPDSQTYCICNSVDDNTRYIICDSCGEWYHVRCSGIPEVLPGFVSGEIKSSCIKFFVALVTKGKTSIKHKVFIMSREENTAEQNGIKNLEIENVLIFLLRLETISMKMK